MSLLSIVITLIVVGVLLYFINALLPMDGLVKKLLNIVVIFALIFWLLKALGLFHYIANVRP